MCHSPTHDPITKDCCQQDTDPFASVSNTVPILFQYSLAINLALESQFALVHTMTLLTAVIRSVAKFVDHYGSENVSLLAKRGQQISSQEKIKGVTHLALKAHQRLFGSMGIVSKYTCNLFTILQAQISRLSYTNGLLLCKIYEGSSSKYGTSKDQGPTIAFNVQNSREEWIGESLEAIA